MSQLDNMLTSIEADLKRLNYAEWYFPKLRASILTLGPSWPLHPDNAVPLKRITKAPASWQPTR